MKWLSTLDMAKNQILNVILQILATDPSGQEGQFYYNSAEKNPKIHDGSAWRKVLIENMKGAANGIASLDASSKVPIAQLPDAVFGQLLYKGVFNASGGTAPVAPSKGDYWIISVAGTISSVAYGVGDWIVYNGSSFDKVDNTDAVMTVAGRTGNIVLVKADITDYTDYVHPTTDGSKHVPANGTGNNGKFLRATASAGVYEWADVVAGGTVNKFAVAIGNGALTSFTVTHNLNSRNVIVEVYETGSPYAKVLCDVEHTDLNTITIKTAYAPTASQYTVVVIG